MVNDVKSNWGMVMEEENAGFARDKSEDAFRGPEGGSEGGEEVDGEVV